MPSPARRQGRDAARPARGWVDYASGNEEFGQLPPKKVHKHGNKDDQTTWQQHYPLGYSDDIVDLYHLAGGLTRSIDDVEPPRLTPRQYLEQYVLPLFDPPAP